MRIEHILKVKLLYILFYFIFFLLQYTKINYITIKGLVLVTDAISALGLKEGVHQLGQLDIEIRKGRAYIAGTNTLCGSMAEMSKCVRIFKEATGNYNIS